jgi:sortase (surface protein transpeptidase)
VLAADTPASPDRIRIPAIGLDAVVVPVGVAPNGEMEVPPSISQVAWYRHGPRPGEAGSAVLAAHVDFDGRPGAFRRLDELALGDLVLVARGGSWDAFRVVGRTTYRKSELPAAELFRRTGDPILTLVTCGGGFNPSLRSYDSNVVVVATPVAVATSRR